MENIKELIELSEKIIAVTKENTEIMNELEKIEENIQILLNMRYKLLTQKWDKEKLLSEKFLEIKELELRIKLLSNNL